MQVQPEQKIERWIEFQELCTRIVAIVASDFPKPVLIEMSDLFTTPSDRSKIICLEIVTHRRALREKLVRRLINLVGLKALTRLLVEAQAGAADETKAGWIAEFQRSFYSAAKEIEVSSEIKGREMLNKILDMKNHDPKDLVRPWHMRCDSYELSKQILGAVSQELQTFIDEAKVRITKADLDELARYVLGNRIVKDAKEFEKSLVDWENSTDRLPTNHPVAMNLLTVLTEQALNEECQSDPKADWISVENIRTRHRQYQSREETLAGTIDYMVEAGIIRKKQVNGVDHYTLSPGMVAPLMSAKSKGSDESGFSLLSKLRKPGADGAKELLKEVSGMVFSAALVSFGRFAINL